MSPLPVETFPSLSEIPSCRHVFINRIPGLAVNVEREAALERLKLPHSSIREQLGFASPVTAEQIHGKGIAVVDESTRGAVAGVDGLITSCADVCLGIYVADCSAVYLVDPEKSCIGLVHSGKKGTDLGIVPEAIAMMHSRFGSEPGDIVVQISPCIRPPHYEVDFSAGIMAQCRESGVKKIHDSGICTASDLERYYSYRAELGKTGRMLALICLNGAILAG